MIVNASTLADGYAAAQIFLAGLDANWARHVAAIGPCRLEPKPAREPYEALIRAIAYQQLHARAGDAILARLLALYPKVRFPSPAALLATHPQQLRECGFSARKATTLRAIAQARLDGLVPTRAAAVEMPDAALIQQLVRLPGVGRWTVEMLLIYTLQRPDILPVDDFGVRDGYRRLQRLDSAPSPRQMRETGLAWQPHRTVAAWYLWRVPAR